MVHPWTAHQPWNWCTFFSPSCPPRCATSTGLNFECAVRTRMQRIGASKKHHTPGPQQKKHASRKQPWSEKMLFKAPETFGLSCRIATGQNLGSCTEVLDHQDRKGDLSSVQQHSWRRGWALLASQLWLTLLWLIGGSAMIKIKDSTLIHFQEVLTVGIVGGIWMKYESQLRFTTCFKTSANCRRTSRGKQPYGRNDSTFG